MIIVCNVMMMMMLSKRRMRSFSGRGTDPAATTAVRPTMFCVEFLTYENSGENTIGKIREENAPHPFS